MAATTARGRAGRPPGRRARPGATTAPPARPAGDEANARQEDLAGATVIFGGELSGAVRELSDGAEPLDAERFVHFLNLLRHEKELSFDRLGRRSRAPQFTISRSGLYAMLTAKDWPTHQQLTIFLSLCRVSPHEHTLWLTEYARGRAESRAEASILEDALPAHALVIPRPDPRHTPAWPAHAERVSSRVPGTVTRLDHFRRGLEWPLLLVFGVVVATVTGAVVLAHAIGVPDTVTGGACVAAAFGVRVWLCVRLEPAEPPHRRTTPLEDDLFSTGQKAAPPVIGR